MEEQSIDLEVLIYFCMGLRSVMHRIPGKSEFSKFLQQA